MPVPYTERVQWWPGTLLSWRWIDREAGLWSGVVRYSHDGLSYEHAMAGDLIEVLARGAEDVADSPCPTGLRALQ